MTDRCDNVKSRPRDYSHADLASEPSKEQKATSDVEQRQEAAREAEARRDAYISSGADEGGRSTKSASSQVAPLATSTPDSKDQRLMNHLTAVDRPIQSDPLGNAIVGMAAGGIGAGVRAAAASAAIGGTGGEVAGAATGAVAKSVGKGVATEVRNGVMSASVKGATMDLPASPPEAATSATPSETTAGKSSNGASMPVKEPRETHAPRIPEALPHSPVVIRG